MKKIISVIEKLPVWYSLGAIFLYSLLSAEFFSTFLRLFPYEEVIHNIFRVFLSISYVVNILSGFIGWIIYAFLFHLMAMLLGGYATFKKFLFASAYPYLIPACMIIAGIILLSDVQPLSLGDSEKLLIQHPAVQLAKNIINYSIISCYLIISILVHYIYRINYIYAFLSVVIPVTTIWLITELVKATMI